MKAITNFYSKNTYIYGFLYNTEMDKTRYAQRLNVKVHIKKIYQIERNNHRYTQ